MSGALTVTAFYKFVPFSAEDTVRLREELFSFGADRGMRGLTLLAEEGINGTVAGTPEAVAAWKELLTQHFGEFAWNDSEAAGEVFPRWFVKIREEIVSIKKESICPDGAHKHLSPEEWDKAMEEGDVVVLDTRNTYETAIGTFQGAVDPGLRSFHEFPGYVAQSGIPKDKKVLMYCTGGIRCEKALLAMEEQGYTNVYQLKGGILAYLKQFPERKFEGECFVFDHRVAVGQHLEPSLRYGLCPHCGDPAAENITCACCGSAGKVCAGCVALAERQTCSKDCRHRTSVKSACAV